MIGVLTPSSNTVLEPLTSAIMSDVPNASAHFSRFRVKEISLSDKSNEQFRIEPQMIAADLLADACVNSIVWSGTSASWLGFEKDREMCEMIKDRTGITASSSVLAINEALERLDVDSFGLVTPYVEDVQRLIVANYKIAGFECRAERHLGETVNFAFSNATHDTVRRLVYEVAESKPGAIAIMCTNMQGAAIARELEQETGIPILDSTAAAVWGGLRTAGRDTKGLSRWGSMFDL
ncbi:aspartate/glutamate racemase family protein [Sedimentitalea sp. JM2-8]|uniref:Aspartate/glutamate racemase family protein n=1 Tax=Sedimentitalea xiamensis TaxID=3050037 RepID=A0ABT7FES8_9RHOB|nr:aspartate/glutamate racemase family protein [Sedimentitalea xiamensis]MDK3073626.1 aspartate/glutamate racemase family protein [Sedimentitalea xiamensis]